MLHLHRILTQQCCQILQLVKLHYGNGKATAEWRLTKGNHSFSSPLSYGKMRVKNNIKMIIWVTIGSL